MERVCVVSASGQNVFFEELLAALESALRAGGIEVERAVDHFPPLQDGLAYLFVPHEYMPLTLPEAHPSTAQLARTVALCTEQPGTQWFEETVALAVRAGRVVDINPEGVAELRRRGVESDMLQLGWVPEWDRWGGDASRERLIDVTFLGGYTERRAGALATCAGILAGRRTALHLAETHAPHTAASRSFLSGERKWEHLASSSILINVHRSPLAYLEWVRVIEAISNGCVVLTEHSLGAAPLVAGEHFVSASYDNLAVVLSALLQDSERVERIRRGAYDMLREDLPLSASVPVLANALADVAGRAAPATPTTTRTPRPLPRPLPARPAEYERLAAERSDAGIMRMALKQLMLGQQDLRRRLEASDEPDRPDAVERHGDRPRQPPKVSVVLTVFNYAHTVEEAIRSVAASELRERELVIVDDASTDGSSEVIRQALAACPDLPATLVTRGRNQGLPRARNLGVRHARGEYVFILDADNAVYPHCLGRLARTLDEHPEAAFAYGILEVFDRGGARDLMSWHPWDPERLRYGNYIDAMAMLRRSVLESVGGYPLDPRLYGWEDFALWCLLADRGFDGVLVPEIVARYRRGLLSMISLTDVDGRGAWSALVEAYPVLTSPPPTAPA